MTEDDATTPPPQRTARHVLVPFVRAVIAEYKRKSIALRSELGLSANEWSALVHLVAAGELTAGELARRTGLAGPTITSLVDRLERANLLERRSDSVDRRRRVVSPTDLSRKYVAMVSDEVAGPLEQALSELGEPASQEAALQFAEEASTLLDTPRA